MHLSNGMMHDDMNGMALIVTLWLQVRCNWRFEDGKYCAAQMMAKDRDEHRDYHLGLLGESEAPGADALYHMQTLQLLRPWLYHSVDRLSPHMCIDIILTAFSS